MAYITDFETIKENEIKTIYLKVLFWDGANKPFIAVCYSGNGNNYHGFDTWIHPVKFYDRQHADLFRLQERKRLNLSA